MAPDYQSNNRDAVDRGNERLEMDTLGSQRAEVPIDAEKLNSETRQDRAAAGVQWMGGRMDDM